MTELQKRIHIVLVESYIDHEQAFAMNYPPNAHLLANNILLHCVSKFNVGRIPFSHRN